MCLVCALHIYLRCTARSRGQNRSVFVHCDEGIALSLVSKHWITPDSVIHSAYRHKKIGREHDILRANPHFILGMAASWAEIARVLASEIFCAATLSDTCTFAQFYQFNFSNGGFNASSKRLQVLEQVKANAETQYLLPFPPLPYLDFCWYWGLRFCFPLYTPGDYMVYKMVC